jgi:hypothetical protein
MKPWNILLVCVMGVIMVAEGCGGWIIYNRGQELSREVSSLIGQNNSLLIDNTRLAKSTYLKSFENEKALARFIQASKTVKSFTEDDYSSDACVSMMKESRDSGYWMGMTAINMTNESVWGALLTRSKGGTVKWMVYNVAIVGDADVYLVDPMDETGYYRLMTMGGDFKPYYDIDKDEFILRNDGIAK